MFKFDLMVYIYRRPNLRDDSLEFEKYLGLGVLQGIFDDMRMMPEIKALNLSFPETWLNVIEQRTLLNRLEHYCPNLKNVVIKTHSVYIIQCVPKTCTQIIGSEEEFENKLPSETNEDGSINLTDKLYTPMVGLSIDATKLNIL